MLKPLVAAAAGLAALLGASVAAPAFEVGIVAFQMSSETHARVANAAADEAKKNGWSVTLLNSEGSLPKHTEQLDTLIQKKVDAMPPHEYVPTDPGCVVATTSVVTAQPSPKPEPSIRDSENVLSPMSFSVLPPGK